MKIRTLTAIAGLLLGATACTPQEVAFWQRFHAENPAEAERLIVELDLVEEANQYRPPPPPPAPPVYQTTGNISMDARPACAVFRAYLTNGADFVSPAIWTFVVDGAASERRQVFGGEADEIAIYFPNDSGDHTVTVRWAGPPTTYRVWTNCGPA